MYTNCLKRGTHVPLFLVLLYAQGALATTLRIATLDFRAPIYSQALKVDLLSALNAQPELKKYTIKLDFESIGSEEAPINPALENMLARKPDILYATTMEMAAAARLADKTIPIVFSGLEDPVLEKLIDSANRPGRNMTGLSLATNSDNKRLELLLRVAPNARHIGVLKSVMRSAANSEPQNTLGPGIRVSIIDLAKNPPVGAICANFKKLGVELVDLQSTAWLRENYKALITCLRAQKIKSIFQHHSYVGLGGMMSYGTNDFDFAKKAAKLIARIINGEPAGNIPIEYPTEFKLAVNLKTIKEVAPNISPEFLKQATTFYGR